MVAVEKEKYKKGSQISGEFKWENLAYFNVALPFNFSAGSTLAFREQYCHSRWFTKVLWICKISEAFYVYGLSFLDVQKNNWSQSVPENIHIGEFHYGRKKRFNNSSHNTPKCWFLFSKDNTTCLLFPTIRLIDLQVIMLYYFCFSVYF